MKETEEFIKERNFALKQEALRLSGTVFSEDKVLSAGLYDRGVQKTVNELIHDAEIILKYLKEGL